MNGLGERIVVGIGELLWDCFPESRQPGGAPANVAFHAGQLGCVGVVCSRVGDDALGRELLAHLKAHGLSVEHVQVDPQRPTGTVTVDVSVADCPRYVIHENVAWDGLEFNSSLERLMGRASAVCFGTLAQRDPVSRDAIGRAVAAAKAKGAGALVVYDVNLRQNWYDRETVEQSLRLANVVKLNADEVVVLAEMLESPGRDVTSRDVANRDVASRDVASRDEVERSVPEFAAYVQERFGVETVCVTRAERGCWVACGSEVVEVPGVPVEVADAVGAGDAFTAGLIAGRLKGLTMVESVRLANEVGAWVASCSGAMPDCRAQYKEIVRRFEN